MYANTFVPCGAKRILLKLIGQWNWVQGYIFGLTWEACKKFNISSVCTSNISHCLVENVESRQKI